MGENITDLFSHLFVSRHYPGTSLAVRKIHTKERLEKIVSMLIIESAPPPSAHNKPDKNYDKEPTTFQIINVKVISAHILCINSSIVCCNILCISCCGYVARRIPFESSNKF
jgi:hypothetical protein